MKTIKIFSLIALSLTLSFCGNDKKSSNSNSVDTIEENAPEVVEVDMSEKKIYEEPALNAKFKNEKIGDVYKAYSKLQNAFVNTNAKNAAEAASKLKAAMQTVGVDETVLKAVSTIEGTTDIELQRTQFVVITAEMEKMLANSLDAGMVYKMYCPMAFKNKGAYWLSSDKQVQNPYFGDKMMRCGRVDSGIK